MLRAWLDHRHEVLVRRSRHRLAAIERRLEILDGYLLVYLNLDEVIRIIREEDEPKPRLMARFTLTDMQAEAILNMRLRIAAPAGGDGDPQGAQGADQGAASDLQALLKDETLRWDRIVEELEETRQEIRRRARWATRRTELGAAPLAMEVGDRGVRRARADHRDPVGEGLDPRGQGPRSTRTPS